MTSINVPYFDNVEVELFDEIDQKDQDAVATLNNFLSLQEADRIFDSRHVFAYCKDFYEAVEHDDWFDVTVPEQASDIWHQVTPGHVFLDKGDDGKWYVVMEAECSWEPEHGLMMVWRDGTTLSKVGGYDGHLTNANARADEKLRNVVYLAFDEKYTTYLADNE